MDHGKESGHSLDEEEVADHMVVPSLKDHVKMIKVSSMSKGQGQDYSVGNWRGEGCSRRRVSIDHLRWSEHIVFDCECK